MSVVIASSRIADADGSGEPGAGRAVCALLVLDETGNRWPRAEAVSFADLRDRGPELLGRLHPDLVVAPLVSLGFDAIDLAGVLVGLGFRGTFRVLTPALPAPEMVRKELLLLCPGMTIELVETVYRIGLSLRR